ncbi:DEAD/DEAH box helicase family protein [Nitratidesulfovibrio sp. D1]|uniref:DEAD/DEAH box helicase family protein n=1 Tax=Nitratidesulfovibrio sp. D1 TaxID=3440151 RepID=UPI003EC14CAB
MSFNFGNLRDKARPAQLIDPKDIFAVLPGKGAKYSYPRDVQADVWRSWFQRRSERDLLIRMNTGSGKTLVGLIILESSLREGVGPALYVVPDEYLVRQVIEQAESLGLSVVADPDDHRYATSESICVVNISKLFNGRSVFSRQVRSVPLRIGTIIIDDAHACVEKAKSKVTLSFGRDGVDGIFSYVMKKFRGDLLAQSASKYAEAIDGVSISPMLVPYWAWRRESNALMRLISSKISEENRDDLYYNWNLVKGEFSECLCFVTGKCVEITLPYVNISRIDSFSSAKRRIYMTATMADATTLISDFDANLDSISRPIEPGESGDIGDRIIIMPTVVDENATLNDVKSLVRVFSREVNVAIIVPSRARAQAWADVTDKVVDARNIERVVQELKSGERGTFVFLNRYDGIDLPGDACRLVVIDGLPDSRTLYEKWEGSVLQDDGFYTRLGANRIEQGMGRGVRDVSDYCAVILVGKDLVRFLYSYGGIDHMSEATKRQFDLSRVVMRDMARGGLEDVQSAIVGFLSRDESWVAASKECLIGVKYDDVKVDGATVLSRNAHAAVLINDYDSASKFLQQAETSVGGSYKRGLIQQRLASVYDLYDGARAQHMQGSAVSLNYALLKPISGAARVRPNHGVLNQARNATRVFAKFHNDRTKYIVHYDAFVDDLVYPNEADRFERALEELFRAVGYHVERPDRDENAGPDVLVFIDSGKCMVIECKSDADVDTDCVAKRYCGQLNTHMHWLAAEHRGVLGIPIFAHPSRNICAQGNVSEDTKIIDKDKICLLRDNFVKAIRYIANVDHQNVDAVVDALKMCKFYGSAVIEAYTVHARQEG